MTDAWTTKFDKTWLASRDACIEFDKHLAKLVGAHWNMRGAAALPSAVLPMPCEATADALRPLGISPSSSIHGTILLALLGELLLCAETGGILRKDTVERFAGGELERAALGDAMRSVTQYVIRRPRRSMTTRPASRRSRISSSTTSRKDLGAQSQVATR